VTTQEVLEDVRNSGKTAWQFSIEIWQFPIKFGAFLRKVIEISKALP
jgi:hypothetical protein